MAIFGTDGQPVSRVQRTENVERIRNVILVVGIIGWIGFVGYSAYNVVEALNNPSPSYVEDDWPPVASIPSDQIILREPTRMPDAVARAAQVPPFPADEQGRVDALDIGTWQDALPPAYQGGFGRYGLTVDGELTEIEIDPNYGNRVYLDAGGGAPIAADVDTVGASRLSRLREGEGVRLNCSGGDYRFGETLLFDCTLAP
ncbi:hypothetical protein [Sphingomicrobium sediminis]|uniref:Uncharacterized protein n=1 Tax=Sphingomicrobium sediminis TaxID=2950949 RepID=A0A9X2EGI6_9SPHN|nr:hypothetical protein [Sphingomicrobium sediminis]MCM8557608.1 hypothetical protein [Sphingomicrobium sediminis]